MSSDVVEVQGTGEGTERQQVDHPLVAEEAPGRLLFSSPTTEFSGVHTSWCRFPESASSSPGDGSGIFIIAYHIVDSKVPTMHLFLLYRLFLLCGCFYYIPDTTAAAVLR